jgi:hypothetical protein
MPLPARLATAAGRDGRHGAGGDDPVADGAEGFGRSVKMTVDGVATKIEAGKSYSGAIVLTVG